MLHQPRSLKRSLALGLAVFAVAPAAAGAVPIVEGQGVAAGGGPGVTAKQFPSQNLTAPDQVDRTSDRIAKVYVPPTTAELAPTPAPVTAPVWPTGPQPVATRHAPTTAPKASPSDDGGLDTGIWVALSGAALVAAGGIGFAGRKRLQVVRQRQLA
jgi:hypothetical protein